MLKAILVTLLLTLSTSLVALDKCITGSWFIPETNYRGINVEVLDNTTVVYMYTYNFFDETEQNWLLFQGNPDDLSIYDTVPFGTDPILYKIGKGKITQISNNLIELQYSLTLNLDLLNNEERPGTPWCLDSRCSATAVYTRLTQPIACE